MNELQILITRRSDGNAALVSSRLDDLKWSTTIPGGFGSCSLFLPGDPTQVIGETGVEYLADIKIMGPGGGYVGPAFSGQSDILFEGRVEDILRSVTPGRVGVSVECLGYQVLTNEPYRNAPIRSDTAGRVQPLPVTDSTIRPEYLRLAAGQGQVLGAMATALDARGLSLFVAASTPASHGWVNGGVEWFPYPAVRIKFTHTAFGNPGGASFNFVMFAYASYSATSSILVNAALGNTAASAYSLAIPSGFRNGVVFDVQHIAADTGAATNAWMLINNPRVLAPRGPSALDDEPVYGHELVQDVVFNSLLAQDFSQITADTTYQFSTADFSGPGQTLRAALDYITGFYSAMWAVWENKTLYWTPTVVSNGGPTWSVAAKQGVTFELDPSIAEAARSVRVSYRDVQGVNREVTYDDPRLDNVFAIAGASKQAQVALPVVANSSAAQQIATTYFPDHSYEVLRGTLTIPAQAMLATSKSGGGMLPAYKMRAGESVRLLDAAAAKDYFSSAYDRKTILFIRTTQVDWEQQTVTLEVDNTRDSLTTLLARVGANVSAKFPGTA